MWHGSSFVYELFCGREAIQQEAGGENAIQVTKSRSPRAKVNAPCIAIFLGSLSAAELRYKPATTVV